MNIWLISKYASPPKYSKMPSRLFHLAKEMESHGNEILLITSDSNHFSKYPKTGHTYNDEYVERVHIRWLNTFKYYKTNSIRRIISWFDFEFKLFRMRTSNLIKPDVIHVSSLSIFTIIYGYYLKKKFNAFLVFEIRDIWPLTMTEEGGFSRFHPLVLLIGWVEKFGYRQSDLIVGTMPNLNKHVFTRIGVDKPFFCLPIGFNKSDYEQQLVSKNCKFDDLFDDKVVIGYAGSFGITNALETFIGTIKLMKENSNVLFVLVGSGDLKNKYKADLDKYENVLFLERMEQNEVKYFLSSCDILYLSTKSSMVWDYGQSMNKVVEYMLAAKPIVASYSGYPSMINEAGCGSFVNNDCNQLKNVFLTYVNMSEEERSSIGLRGREWIYENRSYQTLAAGYFNKLKLTLK